jgi:hypothetical protein
VNPCRNHAGAREREVAGQYAGGVARIFICDACLDREQALLAKARPVFDAMIAAAVLRAMEQS